MSEAAAAMTASKYRTPHPTFIKFSTVSDPIASRISQVLGGKLYFDWILCVVWLGSSGRSRSRCSTTVYGYDHKWHWSVDNVKKDDDNQLTVGILMGGISASGIYR